MISANWEGTDEEVMLGLLAEVSVLRSTVKQLQTVVLTLLNTLEAAESAPNSQPVCDHGQPAEKRTGRAGVRKRRAK